VVGEAGDEVFAGAGGVSGPTLGVVGDDKPDEGLAGSVEDLEDDGPARAPSALEVVLDTVGVGGDVGGVGAGGRGSRSLSTSVAQVDATVCPIVGAGGQVRGPEGVGGAGATGRCAGRDRGVAAVEQTLTQIVRGRGVDTSRHDGLVVGCAAPRLEVLCAARAG
jgi:hypothetical protein